MNENEKIIANIKKSMEFEGYNLESSDIILMNSFLNNEISEKQGIEKIKNEFLSLE